MLVQLGEIDFPSRDLPPSAGVLVQQQDVLAHLLEAFRGLAEAGSEDLLGIVGVVAGQEPQPRRLMAVVHLVAHIDHWPPVALLGQPDFLDELPIGGLQRLGPK